MPQSEINSLTKKTPTPTPLLPQASSSTTTTIPSQAKMHKPSTTSTNEAEKMTPFYHHPIQIGTRGTVGSLVMKEIEYFNQLELSSRGDMEKPRSHVLADHMAASSSTDHASRPLHGSALATQKKKKRGGSRLLPSMCSMVEVSDNNNNTRPVGISGFGYRNLKTDVKKLQA